MAIKAGNKLIQITLTPFHVSKLNAIRNRTGHTNTQVIQRLIEEVKMVGLEGVIKPPSK